MSRAHGKHTGRQPALSPQQDAEYGIEPARQIPGGETHLVNRQVIRQEVPAPEPLAQFRGMMAHGVPPHETRDRKPPGKQHPVPAYAPEQKTRPAIPVYIVEDAGGSRPLRSAAPQSITLEASTGEARRLCGKDASRDSVLLLNESSSSDIRFAQRISDLVNGGGALLPWPGNSYLRVRTQDELWAISADSGTPAVSVIQEFERPEAG